MNDWLELDASPILIAQQHPEASHSEVQAEVHTTAQAADAHDVPAGSHGVLPHEFWLYVSPPFAFLVITILAIAGGRRLRLIPRGMQNLTELLIETLYSIPEMVMGPRGRQYAPFISTFFLYIVVMNYSGLIPAFKAGSASLSITFGLGLTAFFAVQYFGFRAHGIKYLAHFGGPVPWLAFLILPLELIAELIRPVSLSFRLYGNIYGEEQVVEALAHNFGPLVAVLMLPLQVLAGLLQALVFTLLLTVYISLATQPHEEHEAHGEHEEAPAH